MAESQFMIFCSISDLKGVDLFRLDEGAKEDEAMVLVDMKGREVGKSKRWQIHRTSRTYDCDILTVWLFIPRLVALYVRNSAVENERSSL